MIARVVLMAVVVTSSCAHRSPVKRQVIAWPPQSAVIKFQKVPGPVDTKTTKPEIFLRYAGRQILAQRTDGPSFPLPSNMATLLPGWVDGIRVTWDREACLLGGHIERNGRHVVVDGGLCFNGETRKWRAVRLRPMPPELRPAFGPAAGRSCQTVLNNNQRVLICHHSSGGGQAPKCGQLIPETHRQAVYHVIGLR